MTQRSETTTAQQILTRLDADNRLIVLHGENQPASPGWDTDPITLAARRLLPPFPVDALPPWLSDHVLAVSEFTQTPLDLAGCVSLAALSTAAGGRAVLEVRPGWREPLNLYTVVAMAPGSRKSAVFAAMIAPLLDAERDLAERSRPAIVEAELARKVSRRDAERHANAAADTSDPQRRAQALADAAGAAITAESTRVPVLPRLVADDVTPEAAASLLAEQGGRLAVLSAEGGIFATMSGRYSGGVPSLEVFLKGHAGDLLRVDRKGRPAEHVPAPALTLGLAIQPEVLRDIAHLPGFRGRGLLARILYSLPENTVGRRRIGAAAVPATVSRTYHHELRGLVLTLAGDGDPAVLRLSTEANERVLDLERRIEPRLALEADLGHISDWASKLTGATARLTGLLYAAGTLRTAWAQPIPATYVDAAARLGHYFLAHALAVFDTMGANPSLTTLAWSWTGSSVPIKPCSAGATPSAASPDPGSAESSISTRHSLSSMSTASSGRSRAQRPPVDGPRHRPGRFIHEPQKPHKPHKPVRPDLLRLPRLSRQRLRSHRQRRPLHGRLKFRVSVRR